MVLTIVNSSGGIHAAVEDTYQAHTKWEAGGAGGGAGGGNGGSADLRSGVGSGGSMAGGALNATGANGSYSY